jgi:hypothetical protein
MTSNIFPCLRLFGAVSILAVAASAALAQSGPEPGAPGDGKHAVNEEAAKPKKPKPAAPAGYATESEAQAHCHGTIVWIDKDHFNHYRGSREYGKKPGNFACEKG